VLITNLRRVHSGKRKACNSLMFVRLSVPSFPYTLALLKACTNAASIHFDVSSLFSDG